MSIQREALRAFREIPLLSSLSDDELYEIVRICTMRAYDPGEFVFRQGDEGRSLMIVASGRIEIVLEGDRAADAVARLGPGDVLGELSLIDAGPRSATAIATSETTVYELTGEAFETLRQQQHPAAYKIVRTLARVACARLRGVNERIEAYFDGRTPEPPKTGRFSGFDLASQPPDERGNSAVQGIRRIVQKFWGGTP